MLKENLARKTDESVLISVRDPGEQGWESWVSQIGFQVVPIEEADVLLWVDPTERDWPQILSDSRSIVAGKPEILETCKRKNIAYVKDVTSSEAVKRELEAHAQAQGGIALPPKSGGFTVPPALSSGNPEKKRGINLQRGLSLRKMPERVPEATEADETDSPRHRNEMAVALPPHSDGGHRFRQYIHEKSDGDYRVLENADSFTGLIRIAEKGFFEVMLVHRDLPGLEHNLVENIKLLRNKAPGSRIILIERGTDDYSLMYRNHLSQEDIEWQVIPKLPGHIMSILRGQAENNVVFNWDEEETPLLPAVRSKVLSPALLVAYSAGGGVGKSTEATQLGFAFSDMGYKTLVIEMDTEKPSLLRSVGAESTLNCPGLAAWTEADFKDEGAAVEAIRRTSRRINGLYVLPVGPISPVKAVLPFHLEVDGGKACKQAEHLYRAALREFQIVILDANTNMIDPPVFTAMKMAKRIYYVMEPTRVFLDSAETHLEQAFELGIELSNYRIVMNKCTSKDPVNLRLISQTLQTPISMQVPLDVEGYRLAAHHGRAYKPRKGTSPWKGFCETILRDLEVPINTGQEKKVSLKNLLFGWRKKK